MSSGKQAGKGARSYDYYGTVAGLICQGPIDEVVAVLVDGRTVVTGPVTLDEAANELTLDPDAGKFQRRGGRITIYRGDQTAADPALEGHPAYTGLAYLVAVNLLFGRERTEAPAVQVIVTRRPRAPIELVPSEVNTITADGQVSPIAALAELLTAPWGLRLPLAAFDAASWQTAAAWVADLARQHYTHCSPLLTSQSAARQAVLDLLRMSDAVLYWNAAGKIAVSLLRPGVTPGGVITLDARHLEEPAVCEYPGWPEVPTSIEVRYHDRAGSFKERTAKADNLLALRLRQSVPKALTERRPFVTGADQAALHAVEAVRRAATPLGSLELVVRRPIAQDLHPGAKVLVDIDPEPGGDGLAQLAVVQGVTMGPTGPVSLELRPDTLAEAAPYSPGWVVPDPDAADCPPIVEDHVVVIPMPSAVVESPSIAILAPRPRADVIGFRVFLSADGAEFADLGTQRVFACRALLDEAITSTDTEVALTLPEGDTGPDAYLAERYPTTEVGAAGDDLLLVIANLDEDGQVVITDGTPEMEICSIQTRVVGDEDTTYTILRARWGTTNRDWTTDAGAWLTVGPTLLPLTHEAIRELTITGAPGYVRMVATTGQAEDDTVPIPERTFVMPLSSSSAPRITVTTPSGSTGTTDGTGAFTAEFHVEDAEGDLVRVDVTLINSLTESSIQYAQPVLPGVRRYPAAGSVSIPMQVPVGYHELVISAMDRQNPTVTVKRTIYRAPSSGPAIAPVTFNPPPSTQFTGVLVVDITAAYPSTQLEWKLSPPGTPTMTGGANSHPAATLELHLHASYRLWVRAGDGTNWGGWVYADYTKI